MKAGRKPKHEFNSLEVGEMALLKGSAKKYPYQFINQYHKSKKGRLVIVRIENQIWAERVS